MCQDLDRNTYVAVYSITSGQKKWFVKNISYRLTDSQITAIDAIPSGYSFPVRQHFMINYTDHTYARQTTSPWTPNAILTLPSNTMRIVVVWGDNTSFNTSADCRGLCLRLPDSPPDGCTVEVFNSCDESTNSSNKSIHYNSENMINPTVLMDTNGGNVAATRRIIWRWNAHSFNWTADGTGHSSKFWYCYAGSKPSIVHHFFYNASGDFWLARNDTN